MAEFTHTGDNGANARVSHYGAAFVLNTQVQEGRSHFYDLYHEKSAAVLRGKLVPHIKPRRKPATLPKNARSKQAKTTPAERYAIGRYLERAKNDASRMEEAAGTSDFMELAESAMTLAKNLRELWNLRHAREEEWRELLNVLQSALDKTEFERLTSKQCQAIRHFIETYLAGGAVSDDDPKNGHLLLRRVGLDPWRGISAAKEEQ